MEKKSRVVLCLAIMLLITAGCKADAVYQFEIFTANGLYAESSSLDLYFEVVPVGSGLDFIFKNDSTVGCSIANIYFDDTGLLAYNSIINESGTMIYKDPSPAKMPGWNTVTPSFQSSVSFGDSQLSVNGVNPGESLTINFDLIGSTTTTDVINALNNNDLRVGIHLIALPDGTSEAAINVPDPTTFLLLGLGGLVLKRKRKN